MMVEEAGLDPITLEDIEELRGRSQGAAFALLIDEGLI